MIEQIEHELHPFDRVGEAYRYFVVFWGMHGGDGWGETQALVKSTENDVAEVLAWAQREVDTNTELDAQTFQLFVVVEHTEDEEPWLMRLHGPENPSPTGEDKPTLRATLRGLFRRDS